MYDWSIKTADYNLCVNSNECPREKVERERKRDRDPFSVKCRDIKAVTIKVGGDTVRGECVVPVKGITDHGFTLRGELLLELLSIINGKKYRVMGDFNHKDVCWKSHITRNKSL